MFIVVQLPFGDFRPLIAGEKGRLTIPDWTADNLDSGFVKGFGKISPRNASSLGLGGERSFADMNNAVRFIKHIELRQKGWNFALQIIPWFRRLYFDGHIAGRFEFGFLVDELYEGMIFETLKSNPVAPSLLAQEVLSTTVQVNSVDGSKQLVTLANCAQALGHAYIAATTSNAALIQFPVTETYGAEIFVGKPLVHIRVPAGCAITMNRDRRVINIAGEPELFITSARRSDTRNNVLVQASKHDVKEESANERLTRVLFAHVNALLFAHSHFVKTGSAIRGSNKRAVLRAAIGRMIERFERIQPRGKSDIDEEFTAGMKLFAKAYAGRIEELMMKLEDLSEEWNRPTAVERFARYVKGVHDMILTTAVGTAVESTTKGGK